MSLCAICSCVTYAAAASADGVGPCPLRNAPSGTKDSLTGASPQSRSACRPRQDSDAGDPDVTFQPASAQARPSGSSSPPTTSFANGTPRPCLWNLAPYGSSSRSPIQRACGTAVADAMSMMRTMSFASCAVMGRSSSLLSVPSCGSAETRAVSTSCSISECWELSRATDSFAERSRRARSPSASAGVRTPPSSFPSRARFSSTSMGESSVRARASSGARSEGVPSDSGESAFVCSSSDSGVCARDARAHGSVHSSGKPIRRSTSLAQSIPAASRPSLLLSSRTTHRRRTLRGVKDSISCSSGGRRFSVKSTHAAAALGSASSGSTWKHA